MPNPFSNEKDFFLGSPVVEWMTLQTYMFSMGMPTPEQLNAFIRRVLVDGSPETNFTMHIRLTIAEEKLARITNIINSTQEKQNV